MYVHCPWPNVHVVLPRRILQFVARYHLLRMHE